MPNKLDGDGDIRSSWTKGAHRKQYRARSNFRSSEDFRIPQRSAGTLCIQRQIVKNILIRAHIYEKIRQFGTPNKTPNPPKWQSICGFQKKLLPVPKNLEECRPCIFRKKDVLERWFIGPKYNVTWTLCRVQGVEKLLRQYNWSGSDLKYGLGSCVHPKHPEIFNTCNQWLVIKINPIGSCCIIKDFHPDPGQCETPNPTSISGFSTSCSWQLNTNGDLDKPTLATKPHQSYLV